MPTPFASNSAPSSADAISGLLVPSIRTSCSPLQREPEEWVRVIAENNNNPDPLVFDDDDGLDNPDDVPNNPNASPSQGDVNFNNTSPGQSVAAAEHRLSNPGLQEGHGLPMTR